MKQWVAVLQRVFSPAVPLLIMLLLLSGISLPAVFLLDLKDTLPAYILYAVSAYTAAVLSVRLIVLVKSGQALLHKNPFLHKYLTEPGFKAEVSLYTSLGVNLFYAVYKTAAAVYYHSAWFGATAFYYLVSGLVVFLLIAAISLHMILLGGRALRNLAK